MRPTLELGLEAHAMAGLYILFFTVMALLLAVMLYGVFTEGRKR
jgi:hypothetical protein